MRPRGWLAVLALPANVLGTVPALILWSTRDSAAWGWDWGWGWRWPEWRDPTAWLAFALLACGLALLRATITRFDREGDGTLAPWAPTRKLVVSGPYLHVRNPMITGVVTCLLGEALLFRSPALACWAALFFAANALYFPLSEEPGLERRFGESYRRYKAAVPRWVPRVRAWRPGEED